MKKTSYRKIQRSSGLKSPEERSEALDILVRAFNAPLRMEKHITKAVWQEPIFDPEDTRIVVAGGHVVSVVVLGPRMLRFGPAKVPAMTVGPVATHDGCRAMGYGSAAMNDATEYMRKKGVVLAYMQGLRGYYHRFGYFPFSMTAAIKFDRKEAARLAKPGWLRTMTLKDVERLRVLYEKAMADRICVAARDRIVWEWLIKRGVNSWIFEGPKTIVDARGKLCGYLTLNPEGGFGVREFVVANDEHAWRVALGAVVREAKRREANEIDLPMIWGDPMAVFLRQSVRAESKTRTSPDGAQLMMIVDFPALMRLLEPLLTKRWKKANPALRNVRFTIVSGIGSVGITAGRSGIRVGKPVEGPHVHIARQWLSGLVSGLYSVRDIVGREGVRIPASALPALEILFPAGWPFIFRGDHY